MGIATGGYRLGKLNGQHVVTWWEGGKRKRYRLGGGLSQSAANAELIRWVKDREILLERESKTVADIMRLYMRDREIDGKSIEKQRFSWKALEPFFGSLSPDDVEKETCDAYRARRRKLGRQEGTIWTELSVLRAALNWAVKRKKIKHAPHIWLPEQPRAKERHLTREEADKFISELHAPHLRLFVLLALGTAGRAGALFDLRWTSVDWQRRQIDLRGDAPETNKRRAVVPINDTLLAALTEAQAGAQTPYVLEWGGTRLKSVKGAFKRAAARCGWDDVTPHTLRHTAAVWMAEAGVPMAVISQYLGHSSTAVTEKVYARFSPTYLRTAAAALEVAESTERKCAGVESNLEAA
jgi:integrase